MQHCVSPQVVHVQTLRLGSALPSASTTEPFSVATDREAAAADRCRSARIEPSGRSWFKEAHWHAKQGYGLFVPKSTIPQLMNRIRPHCELPAGR